MKIALQLFSIKDISEKEGLVAALDKAKELGYDGVEFAGLFGLTPEEVKTELDKRGLECAGFHHPLDSNWDDAVEMAKVCNAYSVCIPWFSTDSKEEWINLGKTMNDIGKKFDGTGIYFGYHSHIHEFKTADDGKMFIDHILDNCDESNVFFEMDTRHVVVAGVRPEEYIKKMPHRVKVLHARDTNGERDVAVGSGLVDFPAVLDVIGIPEWVVVENINFGENEKELADSVTYLRNTFGK